MKLLQNLSNNLSKKQKFVSLFSIILFIILIIIFIILYLINKPVLQINELHTYTKSISSIQEKELGSFLWETIKLNNISSDPPKDIEIRKESFTETLSANGNTFITFLVDIDSIKQTYRVTLSFQNNNETNPENISVSCPKKSEVKFLDSTCLSSENTISSIENYLPYSNQIDGFYFSASKEYYIGDSSWYIQIKFDTCNNLPKLFEQAKKLTLDYLEENTVDTKDLVFELYQNYHLCPNL